MPGAAFLTRNMVEGILEVARETIEPPLASDEFDRAEEHRAGVYVVVLGERDYLLGETTFGKLEEGHVKYDGIAHQEAIMSLRERMDTREIVEAAPHRLKDGDVALPGGVYFGSFAVGTSGHFQDVNERISRQIGVRIVFVCRARLEAHQS